MGRAPKGDGVAVVMGKPFWQATMGMVPLHFNVVHLVKRNARTFAFAKPRKEIASHLVLFSFVVLFMCALVFSFQ